MRENFEGLTGCITRMSWVLAGVVGLLMTGCSNESKVRSHTEKGDAFFASGDYEKARIEYINVSRIEPNDPHAFAQIGHIFYENGLALKSIAFFSRAIELGENDPRVFARRAVLMAMSDRAKAAEQVATAIELDPTQEEAILLLADLASDEAKITEVRRQIDQLRQAHGELPVYATAEAVLEVKSKDLQSAQSRLEEVLVSNPDFAPAHSVLSAIFLAQTNLVDGGAALKRAAELSPPRSSRQLRYINFLLRQDKEAGLARIDSILQRKKIVYVFHGG